MRMQDIRNTKQKLENRFMLDAMERETKRWPSLENLEKDFTDNFLLPHTILNFGEYQKKLQQLGMYAEQGDHEAMQKLLDNEEIIEKKNQFLQPIYRDIKATISHMTNTNEL